MKQQKVKLGVYITRDDLESTQEEADVIIPYQVSRAIADGKTFIKVICEDTDVFVLLCCYNNLINWQKYLYMTKFSSGKNII